MRKIHRRKPNSRHEIHPLFVKHLSLGVALLIQAVLLLGDISSVCHAHSVDEKQVSHPKNLSPSSGADLSGAVSDQLELASGYAEDVFEFAKAGRWKRAARKLAALDKVEHDLIENHGDLGSENLAALTKTTTDLERAVGSRSRQDAMITANKITAIMALIAKSFKERVPTNVLLLDYYGRELEIWSETKNTGKLSDIVNRMHLTWQVLIPSIIAGGGSKEVKRFGEIMKHLEMAKTPEEYGRLAAAVLDETENLEKVFTQRSSGFE